MFGNAAGMLVQRAARGGRRRGAASSAHILAYKVLRLGGARLHRVARHPGHPAPAVAVHRARRHRGAVEPPDRARGVRRRLTNPKAIVFYTAVLPQFVEPRRRVVPRSSSVVLGAISHRDRRAVRHACTAVLAGTARSWLAGRPHRLERLGGTGGLVMIGLGARLAAHRSQRLTWRSTTRPSRPTSRTGPRPVRLVTARFAVVTGGDVRLLRRHGRALPTLPRYVEDELGGGGRRGRRGGRRRSPCPPPLARPWAGRLGDLRGRRILDHRRSPASWASACCAYALDRLARAARRPPARQRRRRGRHVRRRRHRHPGPRARRPARRGGVVLLRRPLRRARLRPVVGERWPTPTASTPSGSRPAAAPCVAALLGLGTPAPSGRRRRPGPSGCSTGPPSGPGLVLLLGLVPFVGLRRVPRALRRGHRPRRRRARCSSRYAGAVLLIRDVRRPPARPAGVAASRRRIALGQRRASARCCWRRGRRSPRCGSPPLAIAVGHVAAVPGAVLGGGGRRARGPAQPGRRHVLALLRPGQRPRRPVPRPGRRAVVVPRRVPRRRP